MIKIIGLGAGNLEQLPLGVYRLLEQTEKIYLRTDRHPVVDELKSEGISFESFDSIYEKHEKFESVYEEITQIILEKSKVGDVVYAVPGHPMVAEKTVQLLLESGVDVEIVGGQSFLDAMFTAIGVDPVEGFQFLDGTELRSREVQITQHVIISQVYDAFVASEVKLSLMEKYPDDHEVTVVTNAGMGNQNVKKVPLYELDHGINLSNLTSLYVPPSTHYMREFWHLKEIFETLRSPKGCQWDREQTHASLTKNMTEEAAEYVEAVKNDDIDNMIEELGDVLLQIMLNSQIGDEEGYFNVEDVIEAIASKMIRRHPHVFGDKKATTPEEAIALFNKMKEKEKNETR